MKRVVMFLIFTAILLSCSKNNYLQQQSDSVLTNILLRGDYVDISSSPLTKSVSNIYYGFEIDSLSLFCIEGDEHGPLYYDTTYFHYAGGLFDNIDNIGISLDKGHRYRIRCSIIKDREDKLFVKDDYVYEPFVAPSYSCGTKAKINNAFIYGGDKQVYAYSPAPYICTIDNDKQYAAKVDRYFGEVITDVIDDSSPISLDMVRRNFGIHFLLTPPKEGVLKVYCTGNPKYEYILDSNSSSIDEEYIYALDLHNDVVNVKPQIVWTRADGEVVDLSLGKIKFYNKTMTTIKVDVNDRIGNSDIDINLDSEMSEAKEIVIK